MKTIFNGSFEDRLKVLVKGAAILTCKYVVK